MGVPIDSSPVSDPVAQLEHIVFERDGRRILDNVSLQIERDQRWLVLGANGSGKTTLMQIASMQLHPTSGTVTVDGETLGSTDMRMLRRRIAHTSAAFADRLRPELIALDIVKTAKFAALEPWWHTYDDDDAQRARNCLERFEVGDLAERSFATLSSGEQQRVLLARSLMNEPSLVILDEPSARLDLGGREFLVAALDELMSDPGSPPMVLVTHHVDEVPATTTHVLLLKAGQAIASGPIDQHLNAASLSECFGLPLELQRRPNGRFNAWARTD
jgi:iron complex transport system ATP-binding protein